MQAQAVEQLGFVGRHGLGQSGHLRGIGVARVAVVGAFGHRLDHGHALQDRAHVFQGGRRTQAIQAQSIDGVEHRGAIGLRQGLDQTEHVAAVDRAEHVAHGVFLQLATAKSDGLIGERQGVAHGATSPPRDQTQSADLGGHALGLQHLLQVLQDRVGRHGPQVELQTAREHGHRHFLWVGGGQDEFQVLGGLFQGLEHGVERMPGEHVHLVDHEDLEAPLHRFVDGLFEQGLHILHAAVGSRVKFGVVHETPGIDVGAGLTHAARLGGDVAVAIKAQTVERFGQDARDRGLAHTSGAGEQIGVVQALCGQGVGQGLDHVALPHHFGEVARAVFAGQDDVGHGC